MPYDQNGNALEYHSEGEMIDVLRGDEDFDWWLLEEQPAAAQTILCVAAENGWTDAVRLMLDEYSDYFTIDGSNTQKYTPLCAAAMEDRVAMVEMLVDEGGADVDALNGAGLCLVLGGGWSDGDTALEIARERGNVGACRALLRRGAEDPTGEAMQAVGQWLWKERLRELISLPIKRKYFTKRLMYYESVLCSTNAAVENDKASFRAEFDPPWALTVKPCTANAYTISEVDPNAPLSKVLLEDNAYYLDGARLSLDKSARDNGLSDGAILDSFPPQTGGGFLVSGTGSSEDVSSHEIERRRAERQARRAIAKKPRAPRRSVTATMATTAEQLWSATERGILDFEDVSPMAGMPAGGVGVIAGHNGGKGRFEAYLKQPTVVARLEAEGFEQAGSSAPHRWFLVKKPGVSTPAEKALSRSLTPAQRDQIEASRLAALERKHAAEEATTEVCRANIGMLPW